MVLGPSLRVCVQMTHELGKGLKLDLNVKLCELQKIYSAKERVSTDVGPLASVNRYRGDG